MYDPERGWSLSFSGCGFLGFYHIGATRCLSEHAPHLIRDARMLFGSSAGALHAVVFLSGISLDLLMQILVDIVQSARSRNIGTLHPSFNLGRHIQKSLQRHLPDNIHRLISGKMCISLTRVSDGENVLVSDFQSKDEVVDALLCSSFIPFFCGIIPPSFRGVRYMDGGASDNVPFFDAKTTITVSPFYGEYDICPKVMSTNFLHVDLTKLSLRLCSENAYLLMRALFPPDLKVLGEICLRGYLDALRFLEENALSKAVKNQRGYMSKICNFLPIKVMSYMVLPCTLPVESAIAVVQRLVMWLPDMPEDIRWLQWLTSSVCSQVMTQLFPISRSQTPASGQQPSPRDMKALLPSLLSNRGRS
ncbi:1-acylglycerol-3-phosphate O-acyltransferase PNPLA3 isoform X3 [Zalophus californianus]|uniref:Acylglycerol transacylase n=1 Tax=Zalophus californianus TaxID=9704 RepID=A0A6J2D5G6_ZALCA|nr:1-acylglycerol-3-phosphate O-acyltransferase PNPLA3 isoform X3 [Zalophus californianus]